MKFYLNYSNTLVFLLQYISGTDSYDRRPEKKVRAPAWCDRILWKVQEGISCTSVVQESYFRRELKASDHKPVGAVFTCQVRKVISEKQTAVLNELNKLLDAYSNASIPRVQVEGSEVVFKTVYFEVTLEFVRIHLAFVCCLTITS